MSKLLNWKMRDLSRKIAISQEITERIIKA